MASRVPIEHKAFVSDVLDVAERVYGWFAPSDKPKVVLSPQDQWAAIRLATSGWSRAPVGNAMGKLVQWRAEFGPTYGYPPDFDPQARVFRAKIGQYFGTYLDSPAAANRERWLMVGAGVVGAGILVFLWLRS